MAARVSVTIKNQNKMIFAKNKNHLKQPQSVCRMMSCNFDPAKRRRTQPTPDGTNYFLC